MMRGVGRVRKSIHQSSLAKGLGLICWGFKRVQEEIQGRQGSRESVRDDERCGRSKEVWTPELIGQIKKFMDMYIFWCQCGNCTHNYSRGTEDAEDLREVCSKGAQRTSERNTLSWQQGDSRADQFRPRSSWCSGELRWKLDLLLWPTDRVPSGSMLALPVPRKPDRANPPTNFWWPLFLTALALSTYNWFQLDRQSTRNTISKF